MMVTKTHFSYLLFIFFVMSTMGVVHAKETSSDAFLDLDQCHVIGSDQEKPVYFIAEGEVLVSTDWTLDKIIRETYACTQDRIDITDELNVYSNVDFTKEGRYHIIYTLDDYSLFFVQTVFVKDDYSSQDKPIFIGLKDQYIYELGSDYEIPTDVYAYDSIDGNLTEKIEVKKENLSMNKEGRYLVEYSVTSSQGLTNTKKVEILILNQNSPYLYTTVDYFKAIVGSEPNYDLWKSNIVVWDDQITNDLDEMIVINDEHVNYHKIGRYELEINLMNDSTIDKRITRPVYVLDEHQPSIFNDQTIVVHLGTDSNDWLNMIDIKTFNSETTHLDVQVIDDHINLNQEGTYSLYILIKDDDQSKLLTIPVEVKDLKGPDIKVENLIFEVASTPPDFKTLITSYDLEDDKEATLNIDVSHLNFSEIGTYPLYISSTDYAGNVTERVVDVKIVSKQSPVLFGVKDTTIQAGMDYNPLQGVKAIDLQDGDITDQIKVNGYFDSNHEGSYAITLSVKDSDGNPNTQLYILKVEESPFKVMSFYIIITGVIVLIVSALIMIFRIDHHNE